MSAYAHPQCQGEANNWTRSATSNANLIYSCTI
jgi:hypothetical protein